MSNFLRFFIVLVVSLLVSACQSVPNAEGALTFQRGVIIRDSGKLFFRDCFLSDRQLFLDDTGQLLTWFRQAPQVMQQVYVELMVQTDNAGSEAPHIKEVLLVGSHPRACEFELNGNLFRAAGENPLWIADVRKEGIRVQNYGRLKRLLFPPVEAVRDGSGIQWVSQQPSGNRYSIRLRFKAEPCYDQYGTRYRYVASMILNEVSFDGCAREGDLGQRVLPSTYLYESDQQSIRVLLKPGAEALLIEGHQENQETVVTYTNGRWELLPSGRVILELDSAQGAKQILFFNRNRDGSLSLIQSDKRYGRARLTLKRTSE